MNDTSLGDAARFPSLEAEIEAADRILTPALAREDEQALQFQKKFRAAELAIIFGSVLAVGLGLGAGLAPQADMSVGSVPGRHLFSFAELLLTAGLGALAFVSRGLRWQRKWLRRRWAAETLRGERFLFIGRLGAYGESPEPERVLRQRIVEIEQMVRRGPESDV